MAMAEVLWVLEVDAAPGFPSSYGCTILSRGRIGLAVDRLVASDWAIG